MGRGPKKILVVEDEKPIARALELKLKSAGFETAIALDGEVALDLLKKEKFDLVILDLVVPKVDGFGILESLVAKKNKTPVVVISNLSQGEDISRVEAFGVKDYFVKSDVPLTDVVRRVQEILEAQ